MIRGGGRPSDAYAGSATERRVADLADLLVWTTLTRPPTLAGSRLLCVDGRAGSGKTTLAAAMASVATEHTTVRLVQMDDIYPGWTGLTQAVALVEEHLIEPLRAGRPACYQRYDWDTGALAEWHTVEPADLLILEGVGSGASAYHSSITSLVWVEAPRALRLARGLARDGDRLRAEWLRWMDAEDALFAAEHTKERSDVIVDGTGELERAVLFH